MNSEQGGFSILSVRKLARIVIVTMPILAAALRAQPNSIKPQFEAASVKLSVPGARGMSMTGGPGTDDPGHVVLRNCHLESLIMAAYDLETFEISGGPAWLIGNFGPASVKADIVATMPPGTTKRQFELMLQRLLEERFNLVMHVERKETTTYDLALGKNRPKFLPKTTSGESSVGSPGAPVSPALGTDGFPALPFAGSSTSVMGNRARLHEPKATMEQLAQILSRNAGAPVKDMTGLRGEYDINLFLGGNDNDPDQITLEQAVEDQLGLKMIRSKGFADFFIVDHMDKIPTEN